MSFGKDINIRWSLLHLVSMPGDVKDSMQRVNVTYSRTTLKNKLIILQTPDTNTYLTYGDNNNNKSIYIAP